MFFHISCIKIKQCCVLWVFLKPVILTAFLLRNCQFDIHFVKHKLMNLVIKRIWISVADFIFARMSSAVLLEQPKFTTILCTWFSLIYWKQNFLLVLIFSRVFAILMWELKDFSRSSRISQTCISEPVKYLRWVFFQGNRLFSQKRSIIDVGQGL